MQTTELKSYDASHHRLSPSGSARWLACPGSLAFEEELLAEGKIEPQKQSEAAAYGTLAHSVAEEILKYALSEGFSALESHELFKWAEGKFKGKESVVTNVMTDGTEQQHIFKITEDFLKYVMIYVSDCLEIAYGAEFTKVEYQASIKNLEGKEVTKGTADFVCLNGDTLYIVDLKFGTGVSVSAEENSQLSIYALGVYQELSFYYPIKNVVLCISQPRLYGEMSEEHITVEQLLDFAKDDLFPAIEKIYAGTRELVAGDAQCQWCPCINNCAARFEQISEELFSGSLINSNDVVEDLLLDKNKLTEEQKVKIFLSKPKIESWLRGLKEDMVRLAIQNEKAPEGLRLVQGRNSRVWSDVEKADRAIARQGLSVKERRTEPVLLSPAQIEKLLGKDSYIIDTYVETIPGGPTLVGPGSKAPDFVFEDTSSDFDDINVENEVNENE